MKIPKPHFLLLSAFLAFGALAAPHARAQVSVGFFYDTLDPYGEWVQDPDYGYCWHPTNVDENWAPYTDGYWAYTDSGWTWVSYEDYGGIVYHYGRWAHLPGEGWVWVPGNVWAPAWVSWRCNDSYVGWAPLPPEAHWSTGIGFGAWVDARFDIGPGFYSFVNVGDFGAPALGPVILNREQNVTIINNTNNITNITINNSTVYTGGPSYAKYAALSTRPIPTLKLVRQTDTSLVRAAGGKDLAHQKGNALVVIAPKITSAAATPPKVAKTLTDVKADHGWNVVKDPQEREKLRAQIKDQAGSDTTSPAKPVNPEDVKLVADKIKAKGTPKTAAAEQSATPKTAKTKTAKTKATDLTDLENAPAKEEPGSAKATATPKAKKAKSPSEDNSDAEGAPTPKKSKKAKTPSEDESGSSDSDKPSKVTDKNSNANLQPFTSGDDSEKTKKTESDKDSNGSGLPAGQAATTKGEKKSKSDKDQKDEDQGNVPGQ